MKARTDCRSLRNKKSFAVFLLAATYGASAAAFPCLNLPHSTFDMASGTRLHSTQDASAVEATPAVAPVSISCSSCEGLSEISPRYEAFLIDQWGVMHDGKTPYPGAVECIDRLAEAGKQIVLLSNSSRRKGAALSNLERMGFSTGGILDVVTSGQIAWDGLRERLNEPFKSLGTTCLVFGNGEDDLEYVSSCGCALAEAQDADFILARGSFVVAGSEGTRQYSPNTMTGEGKEETLKAMQTMLQRGKKMLVTNPDFLRPGTNDPMPGLMGKAFEEMGGTVHYVGKPHPAVYEACFKALQADSATSNNETPLGGGVGVCVDRSSVAAIGDSLPHDILGAKKNGILSVFVAGGVHFEELGVAQGGDDIPSGKAYSKAFSKHLEGGGTPTHLVPSFRW